MNVSPTEEQKRLAEFAVGIYKGTDEEWREYTCFSDSPIYNIDDLRRAAERWIKDCQNEHPEIYGKKFRKDVLKEIPMIEHVVVFDGYAMELVNGYLDNDDWYHILNYRSDRDFDNEYNATLKEAAEDVGAEFYQLYRREFKVED